MSNSRSLPAGTKWTPQQWEAITQRGCNLLVAAAAGAGKTAVLVERIIQKITDEKDPTDIDRLLVVTFTNAAATEMKQRIGDALTRAIELNPNSKRLRDQLILLGRSNITTIHSFCLDVIRNNFHLLDLDPAFRIAEETETLIIKNEILDELFDDLYEEDPVDPAFLNLVEAYGGGKDDSRLQEMVLTLFEFVQSFPWPEKWLDKAVSQFELDEGTDFGRTLWGRELMQEARMELSGLAGIIQRTISRLKNAEGLEPYTVTFEKDLEQIQLFESLCDGEWDPLYEALSNHRFAALGRCKNPDRMMQEEAKAVRNEVKKRLQDICDNCITGTSEELRQELEELYPMMKCLARLVLLFQQRYRQKKAEKAILDFNDLEHYCLSLLIEENDKGEMVPSPIALAYRDKFEEILVDEYQDSNLVQDTILRSISRVEPAPNLFMVGDVKQSIYRFRQARPDLFMDKYAGYPEEPGGESRKILLYKNFRSRPEVLYAVNDLFRRIMSPEVGELQYTEKEALQPGAEYPPPEGNVRAGGCVELHLLDTEAAAADAEGSDDGGSGSDESMPVNDEDLGVDEEESLNSIQAEARLVVNRIKELFEVDDSGRPYQVYDGKLGTYRDIEYRDIVILMRATRNFAEYFQEELTAANIPSYADTGSGYFDATEVQLMVSLLKIIDNPRQDIPLLSVLRSPIANFRADELLDIRTADRNACFYDAMKLFAEGQMNAAAENGTEPNDAEPEETPETEDPSDELERRRLQRKVRSFFARLKDWRERSHFMSISELIWYLYGNTGYYRYVGALPYGEKRQANLRLLFEKAKQFERTSLKGLFNFITFVERLRQSQGDMGSAKLLGENANVVRIMSIHKSKGLEFPVVIVAGCGKKINLTDMYDSVLFHQELGFGPDYVDIKNRFRYPTAPKLAIRYRIKRETLSEEMRILYVALTRAKEKLILTGTLKNAQKTIEKWKVFENGAENSGGGFEPLPPYEMWKARCYLDWIGPSLASHPDGVLDFDKVVLINAVKSGAKAAENFDGEAEARLVTEAETMMETEAEALLEAKTESLLGEKADTDAEKEPKTGTMAGTLDEFKSGQPHSKWQVYVWCKESLCAPGSRDEHVPEDYIKWLDSLEEGPADNELYQVIDNQLNWSYPYVVASRIPAKITVTELKRKRMLGDTEELVPAYLFHDPIMRRPAFLEEKRGFTPAERGTLTHLVLQHLDLERVDSPEEIRFQVGELEMNELIDSRQAEEVNVDKIYEFFRSPLGIRIRNAKRVWREVPFTLRLKAGEIYPDAQVPEDETVLLQGVIDCCFEEDGGLVLVDYKTDHVPPGGSDSIKEKYRIQIDCYARALEAIKGQKVKEKLIYLFDTGEVLQY